MKPFALLLDSLAYTASRNGKIRLLTDYFSSVPDPQRGYGLAALTGTLAFREAKAGQVRALIESRSDPQLFRWSYDFVGDLAETVALIWPERPGANRPPALDEVVLALQQAGRGQVPALIEGWLDALDATQRWALLKLITGGLRVGVSARLAKTALAHFAEKAGGGQTVDDIEEIWHGLTPPYESLFAWLEGRAERPKVDLTTALRPFMLAHPLEPEDLAKLDPAAHSAEWKWDGIRVQLVAAAGRASLFSRGGESIGQAFPDLLEGVDFDAVLDGELLVLKDGEVAPFNDLQQRLNRKRVGPKLLAEHPAHLRLYDILHEAEEDLRPLPLDGRRGRLEDWFSRIAPARMDLSPVLEFDDWDQLQALRDGARSRGIEGLMVKRRDAAYVAGRPKGVWWKWKRDALTLDTVLMYAQRGHGKRSSFYSDYTFGLWRPLATEPEDVGGDGAASRDRPGSDEPVGHKTGQAVELVPVGKAYSGFTDEELRRLDKWVRDNTTERFGPVRAVRPGLVLEVAFDALQASRRHKSGLAMRFPRVRRIRWDKPVAEADWLETAVRMLDT